MGKNYDLYSPYQRTIDNLKRRIRGYEKMKKDLTKQYRKTNKENQELKEQNKKYKEVINKIKEWEQNHTILVYTKNAPRKLVGTHGLLHILYDKEVK